MLKTIDLTIDKVTTTALVVLPAWKTPHPAVVIAPHSSGLDPNTRWLMEQIAADGYAVIAPNHYHVLPPGVGIPERKKYLTDEQLFRDLMAAVDWIVGEGVADKSRLALAGSSMGGRSTLVGLACAPDLWRCGCVWYGGGAFKPNTGKLGAPASRERLALIERPISGFFGNEDASPSPEDVRKLDTLLTELGKAHEFHRYKAGHGFLNFHTAEKYRAEAALDSLAKAKAFLRQHLGVAAPALS